MTRTEHNQDGPVGLLITGGAATVKVLASSDTVRAYIEHDEEDDLKIESGNGVLSVKIPRGGSNATTVIQGSGGVTIIGDGDIVIGRNIRATNIFRSGGSVNMVTVGGSGREFTVHVPEGSSLDADVKGGDVTTTGVLSSVGAATGSGDVEIDRVTGRAMVRTGSGDVGIADVGIAEVRSGSGDINVRNVARKAELRTGSGDITVRSTSESCKVTAASGSGNVTSYGRGIDLDASTGSGRVRQRS